VFTTDTFFLEGFRSGGSLDLRFGNVLHTMNRIDALLDGVSHLPPAPRVLPLLLSRLTDPDADVTEVVDLITFEPALTAKLIQICNSAFFSGGTPIDSVYEAVNRLGFRQVYQVVAAVTGSRFFRSSGTSALDAHLLWRHSVTAAFAALFVAEAVGVASDLAFTGGLLQDLGKLILAGSESRNAGTEHQLQ
jgi:HD-like signal output (HDOD) protein